MGRTMRVVSWVMISVGVTLLSISVGTAAYGAMFQLLTSRNFDQLLHASELSLPLRTSAALTAANTGVVGKLEIPRLGISVMILEGLNSGVLRRGAGHVPETPIPGPGGNAAIAAHRDTYFRNLRNVVKGDRIDVLTLRGTLTYVVNSTEIVSPEDTGVLASSTKPQLTLITCYPFYMVGPAPKRFIVHAFLSPSTSE